MAQGSEKGSLALGRGKQAGLATRAVARCSAGYWPCWDGCALLKACFAAGMVVLCWRLAFPWGGSGLAAVAIACWECPSLATGTFACEAVVRCFAWGGCSFAGWGGCSFARDRRLAMRDSSSESAYVPSWTGDQSLP
ncbi:hypothetical protein CRG98_014510 [Punica granatum]|uniref:Uncharacterized protein n=1 Tax=Punica granatum TaxID=22663 RepID=A0A2I0K919_PUNGR|nr:hypothetical protein CRG98_014510 [Punica granatum]